MLWITISIVLFIISILLVYRLIIIKKSVGYICDELKEKLDEDTNTLITVNTGDSSVRRLADRLNAGLGQLRKEQLRLKDGNHELQTAITNISHDLRTPLTAIGGYIELLEQEEISLEAREYVSVIKERNDTLRLMTEELFQFSVIAATTEELNPCEADLSAVLEESIAGFYSLLSKQQITPVLCFPPQPVIRILDKNALRRIYDNIISNAVKYSDGDLSIALTPDGKAVFSNSAKALNSVSVGRLFDRFYTVESGRSSTGLGLSIAKLLTERMGGSIAANYSDNRVSISVVF